MCLVESIDYPSSCLLCRIVRGARGPEVVETMKLSGWCWRSRSARFFWRLIWGDTKLSEIEWGELIPLATHCLHCFQRSPADPPFPRSTPCSRIPCPLVIFRLHSSSQSVCPLFIPVNRLSLSLFFHNGCPTTLPLRCHQDRRSQESLQTIRPQGRNSGQSNSQSPAQETRGAFGIF